MLFHNYIMLICAFSIGHGIYAWRFAIDEFKGVHIHLQARTDQCLVCAELDNVTHAIKSGLGMSLESKIALSDLKDVYFARVKIKDISSRNESESGIDEGTEFIVLRGGNIADMNRLPFDLIDFDSFVNLDVIEKKKMQARQRASFDIPLTITKDCFKNNKTEHGHYLDVDTMLRPDIRDSFVETLAAIAGMLRLKMSHNFEVCSVTKSSYLDVPWVLEKCCLGRLHWPSDPVRIMCHEPHKARHILGYFIGLLGFLLTGLSPLLIKCLPGNIPRDRRTRKHDELKTKNEVEDNLHSTNPTGPEDILNSTNLTGLEPVDAQVHIVDETSELGGKTKMISVSSEPVTQPDANSQSDIKGEFFNSEIISREDWLMLDEYTGLRLSLSSCMNRIFCGYSDKLWFVIAVRAFLLFALPAITGKMFYWIAVFYPSFYAHSFPIVQFHIMKFTTHFRGGRLDDDSSLLALCVYYPIGFSIWIMLSCFSITVLSRETAKALYWDYECKLLGEEINCKTITDEDQDVENSVEEINYPYLLYRNMIHNLLHLKSKAFWKVFWNKIVCKFAPVCRTQDKDSVESARTKRNIWWAVLQSISVVLAFPFACLLGLAHVLPICSVLSKIFLSPKDIFIPTALRSKVKRTRVFISIMAPLFFSGLFVFYFWLFNFVVTVTYILVFSAFNVVRHGDTLSAMVFLVSIIVYTRKAISEFNDLYLELKVKTFKIAQELEDTAAQKGSRIVLLQDKTTPLIRKYGKHGLKKALAKIVFGKVCNKLKPYRANLCKKLSKLVAIILLLCFLLFVILYYRIFRQFSEIGQTLLTILTASLPMLVGAVKTQANQEVKHLRQEQEIGGIIMENTLVVSARP